MRSRPFGHHPRPPSPRTRQRVCEGAAGIQHRSLHIPPNRLDTIKEQVCSARHCVRLGRGRFCPYHRSLYRNYGAPVVGPSKQLLVVHRRFLRKALGSGAFNEVGPRLVQIDEAIPGKKYLESQTKEIRSLLIQIADIAFEPRPMHFTGSRPGRTRHASYEAVVGQVHRLRGCYPRETNEELSARLWWAFLTVQYVEMSGVAIHQDRHHFWTSVLRLLLTDAHRDKPSSRYVEYLNDRLNQLMSAPAAALCMLVGI